MRFASAVFLLLSLGFSNAFAQQTCVELFSLTLSPSGIEKWMSDYSKVIEFEEKNNFVAALNILEEMLQEDPTRFKAITGKVRILGKMGRYAEASDINAAFLKDRPTDIIGMTQQTSLLQKQGRHQEALAMADASLAVEPQDAITLSNKANILIALHRPEEALLAIEASIDIQPMFAGNWLVKSKLLRNLKRYPAAVAAIDRAIRLEPHNSQLRDFKLEIFDKMENSAEALTVIESFIASEPFNLDFLSKKTKLLIHLQRWDALLQFMDENIKAFPKLEFFIGEKVNLLIFLGRLPEARNLAYSLPPGAVQDLYLSRYYMADKKWTAALTVLNAMEPSKIVMWMEAESYFRAGKMIEARAVLFKLVQASSELDFKVLAAILTIEKQAQLAPNPVLQQFIEGAIADNPTAFAAAKNDIWSYAPNPYSQNNDSLQ